MSSIEEIYIEAEDRMEKTVNNNQDELAHLRAGRANPSLLDRISVEAYDTHSPINQLANVTTPDATTFLINPYDPHIIKSIERAILQSDLGLTPINDGRVIRINLPKPTAERRKELIKIAYRISEEGRVALRNIRRDAIEHNKKLEKAKEISEDDLKRGNDEIEKLIEKHLLAIEESLKTKTKEIEDF